MIANMVASPKNLLLCRIQISHRTVPYRNVPVPYITVLYRYRTVPYGTLPVDIVHVRYETVRYGTGEMVRLHEMMTWKVNVRLRLQLK